MTRGVKSFRLYMPRPIPVSRFAKDYTEEERVRFREVFRPVAEHYRYRVRIAYFAMAAFFLSIVMGFTLPESLFVYIGPVGFCGCVFAFLVALRLPNCPACSNALGYRFGRYCPECSGELQPGSWWNGPRCRTCGTLSWGRGRSFGVRVCTHCGVFLDARGL